MKSGEIRKRLDDAGFNPEWTGMEIPIGEDGLGEELLYTKGTKVQWAALFDAVAADERQRLLRYVQATEGGADATWRATDRGAEPERYHYYWGQAEALGVVADWLRQRLGGEG